MHTNLSNTVTEQVLTGITIPPCPESLTSIMREVKKPSADIAKVAHLIERDAGIVGPLLKLANSPFIGLRNKVASVLQAVNVLGMQSTLNLVQNIALRQSIAGNSHHFEVFWERSSMSASVAEKMAAKFPSVSKDDAYITSLFHDCGIPVLMVKHPQYRETVKLHCESGKSISDAENDAFYTSHSVVGNMLTRSWLLPAQVCKAILHHHDISIFSSADEQINTGIRDLIAIVHMADRIVDEHLNATGKEWLEFEHAVLKHFEISAQEFFELKQDILAFLNGE